MNTEYDQGWKDGYKHGAWASEPVAEPRKQTAMSDERMNTELIKAATQALEESK